MKMLSVLSTLSTLGSAFLLACASGSCGQGTSSRSADQAATPRQVSGMSDQHAFAYDLAHPAAVYVMPKELREISGISFYKGDPALLYAEQDEKGRLYWLRPGDARAHHYDFGKDGDYEDLAFTRSQAVLLKSDGTLYSFDFTPAGSADGSLLTGPLEEWKGLLPAGEYEGLYADTGNNQIYVLCKACKQEDHRKTVTIYRLENKGQGWISGGTGQVDVTRISALAGGLTEPGKKIKAGKDKKLKHIEFKPSAITRNPLTDEWYILSSVNKMLVVTGSDWQVKAVYPVDSDLYPQPEGICLDRDNNLYISNEGPPGGQGTVLKFNRK